MKKILYAFAMLAASLMTVISCEEMGETAEITPDADSQALFADGIHFSASPSEGELTAKVTIHCGEESQSLNVTQAGQEPETPTFTIKLDQTEVEMTVGEVLQLIAEITPPDPVARQISWSSSDTQVATVTTGDDVDVTGVPIPGGIVTAVGAGEAIITAKAGDIEATCKVTVVGGTVVDVSEIKLDQQEIHMTPGQSVQLSASVKPEEAAGERYQQGSGMEQQCPVQ